MRGWKITPKSSKSLQPQILRNELGSYVTIDALAVDAKNLFAADSDGGLTVWEKPDLVSSKYIPGQTSTRIITLHSDGQYLYSGSDSGDPVVRVYTPDLDLIKILKGHVGTVFDIVTDSDFLFTGSGDATAKIWKKDGWNNIDSITAQTHFVLAIAIDSEHIYAGGIDNCTNIFSRSTLRRVNSLYGHDATILSLAVDNDYVYSGSGELWWGGPGSPRPPTFESSVRVWDKKDWDCVHVLKGHSDNVNALGVDEFYVYSASDDGTVRVYSKSDWSEVLVIESGVGRVLDLIHDDSHVYFGCADGNIRFFSKDKVVD
jgi:WD40 repeat protein